VPNSTILFHGRHPGRAFLDGIGAELRQKNRFYRFVARITVVKSFGPEDWDTAARIAMANAFPKPEATGLPGDLLSPRQLLRLLAGSGPNGQEAPALIIDLRSRSRYRRSHVPGSHNIPSGWLISGELPDGDLILVGESTRHSAATIDHLQTQGHARRIRHLAGGFGAWQHQDLPVAGRQRRRWLLRPSGLLRPDAPQEA
jgi:rhodanese-related sulfurtransferase